LEHPLNKCFEHISILLKSLPNKPGVYQYFDDVGTIIYIGKAKNLKKRVTQYFQKTPDNAKLKMLVSKIADLKYIVVETEIDALLLENNLIKKYLPRYNILLKDDKTYPWICIKSEPFPRIFQTRNLIKDGSNYFGPYPSHRMMFSLLEMIRQLYQIRTCKLNLSNSKISERKYKVCLEYHLKRCKAPCINLQTEEDYLVSISQIENIIKGNTYSVIKQMKNLMMEYAEKLEFEKAQIIKEKIQALENYQSKSLVVNPNIEDVDVFSIADDEKSGYINYIRIVNGYIVSGYTYEIKKQLCETKEDLLTIAIADVREKVNSLAKEIIVPFMPDFVFPSITYTIPLRGDKKKLLEMSERNAKYFILEKQKQASLVDPERHTKRIMETMQKDIGLKKPPLYIECFDNSNIQGTNAVAAMVCFRNGKPSKNEYRHYNIKTVEGPDDYASMSEVVYRRYSRLINEKLPLPDLIVIDGGKGQLSAALKSLIELKIQNEVEIIGIAKKLEEIYKPYDSIPLYIDKKSESLRIIQHIRDEAHRFGITHHRNKREKSTIKTELSDIKGIGDSISNKLLEHFRSVKSIKSSNIEEIEKIIGKSKAKLVFDFFNINK